MAGNQVAAAEYIQEMADQLAQHARHNGLHMLAYCLEMAVAEAAATAAKKPAATANPPVLVAQRRAARATATAWRSRSRSSRVTG